MDGLFALLVLGIIIVPIIIIGMLAGIRNAITELSAEQREMRRQIGEILAGKKDVVPDTRSKAQRILGSREAATDEVLDSVAEGDRNAAEPREEDVTLPEVPVAEPIRSISPEIPLASVVTEFREEPPAEAKPSKFQETVEEILGKIWNWFLVGEEHRSKNVTAEYAIASVWLLRVGIIAVVTGVGFFLKLSIQRGWVGEEMRTAMSFLAGAVMVGAGIRMLGKKYHVLGQGFLGGGVAVLYFSAFAASVMYGLVPDWLGFVLMALVTVAAGVIAVRADSMTVAILGIVGGYVSPFFFGEGVFALPILYSYLLILGVGVLGVAYNRQWRFLHYLAFLFTYGAYFYSLRSYVSEDHFGFTIVFLSLFFVVHSAVVYIHHLSKKHETSTLDIVHLVANAGVYSAAAYFLIEDALGSPYPAFMSLGLAIYCIAHVAILIRRQIVDRKLMVTLIGLAGAFTVWTLPIVFDGASLTISFALLALLFVWLGQRMASNAVTNIGEVVFGIVFIRLLAFDFPNGFGVPNETLSDYWRALGDRIWTFGVSIGSIAAAFYLQRRPVQSADGLTAAEGNDMPALAPGKIAAGIFYWVALGFGFALIQLEFSAVFQHFVPFRLPVLTVLWCVLGGYLLVKASRSEGDLAEVFIKVMTVVLCIAVGKLLFVDLMSWRPSGFVYGGTYPSIEIVGRLLDFGTILIVLLLAWRWMPKVENSEQLRNVFGFTGLGILFLYLNLELRSFLHWKVPGFEAGGISILWAVFAIALVVPGILKSVRGLRIVGLSLFGCTVIKVFLSDLSDMDIVFRVIAAVVVGIVLLLGSFAYIHSSARFNSGPDDGEGDDEG